MIALYDVADIKKQSQLVQGKQTKTKFKCTIWTRAIWKRWYKLVSVPNSVVVSVLYYRRGVVINSHTWGIESSETKLKTRDNMQLKIWSCEFGCCDDKVKGTAWSTTEEFAEVSLKTESKTLDGSWDVIELESQNISIVWYYPEYKLQILTWHDNADFQLQMAMLISPIKFTETLQKLNTTSIKQFKR